MKSIEDELGDGAVPSGRPPTPSHKTRMSGAPASIEEVDLKPAYVEAVSQFADLDLIRRANFNFAIHSMSGSGREVLPKIFNTPAIPSVANLPELHPPSPTLTPASIPPS